MFKLFILLSAAAVFASAASVKSSNSIRITPEQLHLIFQTIERDIRARQVESEEEIDNILAPAKILIDAAKEALIHEIEEANQIYHEVVERLEEESHNNREIERCVEEANLELETIDHDIFERHAKALDEVQHRAEEAIVAAIKITTDALEDLDEFKVRVELCDEERCADELHVELVEIYERIVKVVDGALSKANEEVLIALPDELDREHLNHLDREAYEETLHKLVDQVERCAEY